MKKQAKALIALSAILVICIGSYIGLSMYNAEKEKQESSKAAETQLYSAAGLGSPTGISYTVEGNTLSFVLENGQWYAADNRDFPLKQTDLTGLASSIESLSAVRTLETPGALSAYGLDNPAITIKATDADGGAFTLLVGAQNGSNYYALTDAGSKIYTISSTLISSLKTNLLELITLDSTPTLTESTITSISLKSSTASLNLDKHTNKDSTITWFIVNGSTYTSEDDFVLAAPSDNPPAKLIGSAVTALGTASFSSCAAYNPSADELASFGLDNAMTVSVNYTSTDSSGNKTDGTIVYEVGNLLADGSGYYARILGSKQVNILPAGAVDPLSQALAAMGSAA